MTAYPEHWNDDKLANFLRDELTRIPQDAITVHVTPWMFKRMAEIVIGSVHIHNTYATFRPSTSTSPSYTTSK